MTTIRTTCPYCGVGCGVAVTRAGGRSSVRGDDRHPANFGRLCSKGSALGETLLLQGRLLHPLVRGERTDWHTALGVVADGFRRIIAEDGPDAVAFYVSGQLLTEDYYVANKLMKGFIGGANIDTNSRLCMASAVAGYKRAFGADFVPNVYEDFESADLFVLVGSNMAWCHPILYQRMVTARTSREARVVVIDPRRTATCAAADLHLPIAPGTDAVLFNGLLAHIAAEGAVDAGFVAAHTEGFAEALEAARHDAPSIDAVAAACGVPAADLERFYGWFARTPRALTLFSQGVNQSSAGTDKVNAIVNVHLATGRIGKPGAGPFSLTGQPNAMGGREVGGLANQLAAHMDFTDDAVERVRRFWRAPSIAAKPGLKAVELFDGIASGRVRAVWIMSTNPVVSMPDADKVRAALSRCELVVVSDCVSRTDTTALAHVLLPAAGWGEKSGTVTNSERRISRQRAFLPLPGASRPDWWIVSRVARRMGFEEAFDYRCPAQIFREHARLSAFENGGSRDFDIGALASLSDADYDMLEPVQWPAPARPETSAAAALAAGRFFTPTGKARFVATPARVPARTSAAYPFVLNTGRVRDHWHTMTRTGMSPLLSQRHAEPFVQVHPADAAHLELVEGSLAELRSTLGRMLARVEVTRDVRRGEVFAPMHWSARFALDARVGVLLEAATDPVSGQPELKLGAVALAPYVPEWYGFVLAARPLEFEGVSYRVAVAGDGYWRYELAGAIPAVPWGQWSRSLCGGEHEWLELEDRALGRYRAAALDAGRLAACIFIGTCADRDGRRALGRLFCSGRLDERMRLRILSGRLAGADVAAGKIVCACFAIGREQLIETIRTRKLTSTREIGTALRAGSNCGSCLPELDALLAEARLAEASALTGA